VFKGDNYFDHIVNRLRLDDIGMLAKLFDEDATVPFKAMSKKTILEELKISEANLRKTIYRLEAVDFVQAVTGIKEHKIYITELGALAIQEQFKEELEV
jgi:hypothetical protein